MNKVRLNISIAALVAVIGSTFAYAFAAKVPNRQVATTVNATSTQVTSVKNPQPAAISARTRSYGDDEGSEGEGEGGEGEGSPTLPSPAPATMPPSSSMMGGNGMMSKYKDGTYSATGSYNSPGGPDSLGVTITLKGGIITAATVTNGANDPRSSRYQDMFIGGFKQYVIGKSINNVQLDYVSGSSLTPIGWNDAIAQIKVKAQA